MKKRRILKIIELVFCTLFIIVFFFSYYVNYNFGDISFEQVLFNIIYSEGADYTILYKGVSYCLFLLILFYLLVYIKHFLYLFFKVKVYVKIGFKNNIKSIDLFKKTYFKTFIFLLLFGGISLYKSYDYLNLKEYIDSQKTASTLFEDYYVDGRDVKIEFPEKKRNLIHVYLESMESSYVSKENGGVFDKSLIPNLEKIALENINFSNTDKIGGALRLYNTDWTMAALVATTAGIPLKVLDGNNYKGYGQSFPGVYNLGDILKDNGYDNYFMIGSDADFGGRKDYFQYHGDYKIIDFNYAKETKMIPNDYLVWWGYEDLKLFEFAKKKLIEISKNDEPFNFTMLTVDTHFTDGYMDSTCKDVFDAKYKNSIYCSDSKVYKFIEWVKKQDFYENTTIVLVGDHLTMQNNFVNDKSYQRTVYNTFVNSVTNTNNTKNRLFSSFDLFPTTLASLGIKIENNKLGLGVDLFSKEKTLIEIYNDIDLLNFDLSKKSFYFDNMILGETYYQMNDLK